MTKEEAKEWFIDKWDSCYPVFYTDYPNSIFLFYDESVIRKIKLCKLNSTKIKINKILGNCLFELDFKNGYVFCDYYEIWLRLESNLIVDDFNIQLFIKNIFKEQNKINDLKTIYSFRQYFKCYDKNKLKKLTPHIKTFEYLRYIKN